MRALQMEGPGIVREVNVPIPEIADDEVLIRIAYSGICATDYEILSGEMGLVKEGKIKYPVRFGHEYSGTVVKAGSAVKNFKPGDHVIGDAIITCGKCPACLERRYEDCTTFNCVGTMYCWDGSFAEYMHLPERHLFKLPDSLSLMQCALIEPSCVALEGLKRGGDLKDKTVAIIGTGAIGMTAVAMASHFKPAKIILVGRTEGKLAIGRKLGAQVLVNARQEDALEAILRETGGQGADFVLETSGNLEMVNKCVRALRYGGAVAYIGFYDNPADGFPIDIVVSNKITVSGVMSGFGVPAEVIRILEEDKTDLTPIISHLITMDEAPEALLHPEKLPGDRIKIMVKICGEGDV
ncbi:MAG: alcohol dehydrogenase catalytic domain-containing protein [Clostridia bacterium]|nr:alcohol dehydrogenase catalytic domain-containing protein [Clostridia bacterium]